MEPRGRFEVCKALYTSVPCRQHLAFSVGPQDVQDPWQADAARLDTDEARTLRVIAFALMECVRQFIAAKSGTARALAATSGAKKRRNAPPRGKSCSKSKGAAPRSTDDVRAFRMIQEHAPKRFPVASSGLEENSREMRVYRRERQALFEHLLSESRDTGGAPDKCGQEELEEEAWWRRVTQRGIVCLVEYVFRSSDTQGQRTACFARDVAAETFGEFVLSGECAAEAVTVHWLLKDALPEGVLDAMLARLLASSFPAHEDEEQCGNVAIGRKRVRVATPEDAEAFADDEPNRDLALACRVASRVRARSALRKCGVSARQFAAFVHSADKRARGERSNEAEAAHQNNVSRRTGTHGISAEWWLSCENALLQRSQQCREVQTFRHWVQRSSTGECYYTGDTGSHSSATDKAGLIRKKVATRWRRPPGAVLLCALPNGGPPVTRRLEEWLCLLFGRNGFTSLFETLYPTLFSSDASARGDNVVGSVEEQRLAQSVHWMDQAYFAQHGVCTDDVPSEYVGHAPGVELAMVCGQACLPTTVYAVSLAAHGGRECGELVSEVECDTLRESLRSAWEAIRAAVDRGYRLTARRVFADIMGDHAEQGASARDASDLTSDTFQCLRRSGMLRDGATRVVRRGDTTQREFLGCAAGAGIENSTLDEMREAARKFEAQVRSRYAFFDTVLKQIPRRAPAASDSTARGQYVQLPGRGERRAIVGRAGKSPGGTQLGPSALEYLKVRAAGVSQRLDELTEQACAAEHFAHVLQTTHRRDVLRAYERFGRGASAGISDVQRATDRFVSETGLYNKQQRVGLHKLDSGLDTLSNLRAILTMWYDCVYNCAVPTALDMLHLCSLDASRLARDAHLNVLLVGPSDTHKAFLVDCLEELRIGGAKQFGGGTLVRVSAKREAVCTRPDGVRDAGDGYANGCVWVHNELRTIRLLCGPTEDGEKDETAHERHALRSQLDRCTSEDGGAVIGVHVFTKRGRVCAVDPALLRRTIVLHMEKRKRDAINTQSRIASEYSESASLNAVRQKRDQCNRLHHFMQAAKSDIERLIFVGAMRDVGMDLFAMVFLFLEERLADRGVTFMSPHMLKQTRALVRTLCIQDVVAREFCFEGGLFRHQDATPEAFLKLESMLVVRMNHVTVGLGMILPHLFPRQVQMVRDLLRVMFVKQLLQAGRLTSFVRPTLPPLKRRDLVERGVFLLEPQYVDHMRPDDSELLLGSNNAQGSDAGPRMTANNDVQFPELDDAAAVAPGQTPERSRSDESENAERDAGGVAAPEVQSEWEATLATVRGPAVRFADPRLNSTDLCLPSGTVGQAMRDIDSMPKCGRNRPKRADRNVIPPASFARRQPHRGLSLAACSGFSGTLSESATPENPIPARRRPCANAALLRETAEERQLTAFKNLNRIESCSFSIFVDHLTPLNCLQGSVEELQAALAANNEAERLRVANQFGHVLDSMMDEEASVSDYIDCSLACISMRRIAPNLRNGYHVGDGSGAPAAVLTELLAHRGSYGNVVLDKSAIEYALDIMKTQWTRARRYTVTSTVTLTGKCAPMTRGAHAEPVDLNAPDAHDVAAPDAPKIDVTTARALELLEARARKHTNERWLKLAARRYCASLVVLNARATLIRRNAMFAEFIQPLKQEHYGMLRMLGTSTRWNSLMDLAKAKLKLQDEVMFLRRALQFSDERCLKVLQKALAGIEARALPVEDGERAYIEAAIRVMTRAAQQDEDEQQEARDVDDPSGLSALLPRALGDEHHKPSDKVLFFDARVLEEGTADLIVPTHWLVSNAHDSMDLLVRNLLDEFLAREHQTAVRSTWVPDPHLDAVYTTFTFGEVEQDAEDEEEGSSEQANDVAEDPLELLRRREKTVRRPLCVSRLNMLKDLESALSDAMLNTDPGAGFGDSTISERIASAHGAQMSSAAGACDSDFSELSPASRQWETVTSGGDSVFAPPKLLMTLNVSAEAWAVGRHARRCKHLVQHVSPALMALCAYALDFIVLRADPKSPHRDRRFGAEAFQSLDVHTDRALIHTDYAVPAAVGDPMVAEAPYMVSKTLVAEGTPMPHWRAVTPADPLRQSDDGAEERNNSALNEREQYLMLLHALTPVLESRSNRRDRTEQRRGTQAFRYPDTLRQRYTNARVAEVLRSFGVDALPASMVENASDSARISARDAESSTQVLKVLTNATAAARNACLRQHQETLQRTHAALNVQLRDFLQTTRLGTPGASRQRATSSECTSRRSDSVNLRRLAEQRRRSAVVAAQPTPDPSLPPRASVTTRPPSEFVERVCIESDSSDESESGDSVCQDARSSISSVAPSSRPTRLRTPERKASPVETEPAGSSCDDWDADEDFMDTEGESALLFSAKPATKPPTKRSAPKQRAEPRTMHDSHVLSSERRDTKWLEFV